MSEWISVKERHAPPMETVLLCVGNTVFAGWNESVQPNEEPSYCKYNEGDDNGVGVCFGIEGVTHWMPLPSPPITMAEPTK